MSTATWNLNAERQGVEIRFTEKPPAPVLDALKAAHWRWNRSAGCWYHKDTPQMREFATRLAGGAIELSKTVEFEHPVYTEHKRMLDADPTSWAAKYLVPREIAQLCRSALKRAFPATTFSVTSRNGAVNVSWRGEPLNRRDVQAVTGQFDLRGFDGMIDLAYSYDGYLTPDGRIINHSTTGTTGSMGTVPPVPDVPPSEPCIKVSSSCFVFEERRD